MVKKRLFEQTILMIVKNFDIMLRIASSKQLQARRKTQMY